MSKWHFILFLYGGGDFILIFQNKFLTYFLIRSNPEQFSHKKLSQILSGE